MTQVDRRRPRPVPQPVPAPTTMDIERMLHWAAAEARAERRFSWYLARCPSRFIRQCRASEN